MNYNYKNRRTSRVEDASNLFSIVWTVCKNSRALFSRQLDQSAECKQKCVLRSMGRLDEQERTLFLRRFNALVNMLLDIKRFNDDCADLELEPVEVAQHIVFEGKKMFDAARDYGIELVFADRLQDFKGQFLPDSVEE